ncbi:sensor histidine kinase [Piscinibacter sp.]|uniref:sensor histidine kinase n=1 Tax=Piscinibacter sp. TaxID=1903157 RepID=UPI002BD5874A|nr:histidine kinase [Albitalea sp.]HUG23982.1 histidine kinase [Albitalea sp.]
MSTAIEQGYWQRVRAGLSWPAFGTIILLAWLVSTQVLFQPHLFEMWELPDIAQGWANFFGEVSVIGVLMWLSVVAAEQCRLRKTLARGALLATAIVAPVLLAVWLITWQYSGQWWPAAPAAVLGETLKYSMLGGFVYAARALQHHAERANAQALTLDAARRELEREASEAQLQLLQAQIEPHFLFNTLANVRRLYRKHPAAGAQTIDNLMTYLRAALPQVRRAESTLGEEFDLARAYLQLFQVRMGPRLRFIMDLPPALRGLRFPPMVLVTLAENAIKHGLAPADLGGTVQLTARLFGGTLEVSVADDGVGFGADTGGHGVGLVNIRRQLSARFGEQSSLSLEQRESGGVIARLTLPCSDAPRDAVFRAADALRA